jgi:hypothetical protein
LLGKHLRAQADAEERPLLPERDLDPVDFLSHILVGIVGAHGPAENHRAGVSIERFGQLVAKARPTDIQPMPQRPQHVADPARRRLFLMQDDQHRRPGLRARECGSVALRYEGQPVFASTI